MNLAFRLGGAPTGGVLEETCQVAVNILGKG